MIVGSFTGFRRQVLVWSGCGRVYDLNLASAGMSGQPGERLVKGLAARGATYKQAQGLK